MKTIRLSNLSKEQLSLRLALSIAVVIIDIAIYFAFGFFFDVFAEIVPILFVPIIAIPFIMKCNEGVKKGVTIIISAVLIVLSLAASVSVGVIATSKPAFGTKPVCGNVTTYTYSRTFMRDNYDINQQTKIYTWIPENYSADKKYPVAFVLDGDNKFDYTALKASEYCRDGQGDVIVVGIGYGYWNEAFARGGIVWQDKKHVKGRWRDFYFSDDTQIDDLGESMGGEYKRGIEFSKFIRNTVVKDILANYSIDVSNSTIYGHSMGGSMAAYLLTQYSPALRENNPFTNFVIVDNGFLGYYNTHYADLQSSMDANGGSAYSEINILRMWGGAVNPKDNDTQIELCQRINDENWTNVNSYVSIPSGANHSDTITCGIDAMLKLIFNMSVV